jgi:hypothetical protein
LQAPSGKVGVALIGAIGALLVAVITAISTVLVQAAEVRDRKAGGESVRFLARSYGVLQTPYQGSDGWRRLVDKAVEHRSAEGPESMIKLFSKALLESSFARVQQHTQNRSIGMILASRSNLTSEENRQRHTALKSDVRKAGYGFIDIKGRYVENYGKANALNVDQHSLLVVGKIGDDKGHLLGHLKHLATKYNQDSILHKPHKSEKAWLHGTNETGYPGKGKAVEVGSWHPNRTAEFNSMMKNEKRFAFGEQFQFLNE